MVSTKQRILLTKLFVELKMKVTPVVTEKPPKKETYRF